MTPPRRKAADRAVPIGLGLAGRDAGRKVKFGANEIFDSGVAGEAEAEQRTAVFEVDMKIEEWTAFAFVDGPGG